MGRWSGSGKMCWRGLGECVCWLTPFSFSVVAQVSWLKFSFAVKDLFLELFLLLQKPYHWGNSEYPQCSTAQHSTAQHSTEVHSTA